MRGKRRTWTDAQLASAVARCTCLTDVLRELGLRPAGDNHRSVRRHVERLGLSTGHFTHDRRVRGLRPFWRPQTPEVQVFCRDSSASPTVLRRKARQRLGPIVCAGCANPGWHNGAPLTLQLDHINGVHNDNRVENLRWLCPNCHSQTASYAGRGSKRRWTVREPRAAYVVRRAAFSGLPAGAYSPSAT